MPFELTDVLARRVSSEIALEKVIQAIERREPFSMVRQNDGEAVIPAVPNFRYEPK
jgi:hypothetical protein